MNKKIELKESSKQNPMGSGEPLESQVGSGGQPDMLHKISNSQSGCGMRSNKSISSVEPEVKKREQLSLSLSPSLSHSEGDREIEREEDVVLDSNKVASSQSINLPCTHGCCNGNSLNCLECRKEKSDNQT